MKRLSPRDEETAGTLALALADAMMQALPSLFAETPEAVVAVALPIAQQLVRYERRSRGNRKAARKYRTLCREANALVRAEDGAVVDPGVLPDTIPFDPHSWHTTLSAGIGSEHLEVG